VKEDHGEISINQLNELLGSELVEYVEIASAHYQHKPITVYVGGGGVLTIHYRKKVKR